MSNLAHTLVLCRLVAAWSDRSQKEAAKFVDGRRDVLPHRISSAQLYGLGDVVRSAHRFSEIQQFVGKQGEKAKRAGRMDVQDYWVAVEKALHGLRKDAENLWQEAVPPPAKVSEKSVLDALHCKLAAEFVRHLIAHSLYWSPLPKKEK